jgi:Carboxypeptidase regulatory-like domain
MPRRLIFFLLLSFAAATGLFASPQNSGYRISGMVVDSLTGQPLDRATVNVVSSTDGEVHFTVLTSSDGRFLFANLPAAKFVLTASRPGYVYQGFHQHEGFSTAIVTGPGKNSENVRFPLARSAVISGVVTDEWGDPVRDAQILLFEYGLTSGSRDSHIANRAATNDLGQYRLAHLHTGNYTVMVIAKPWYASSQFGPRFIQNPPEGDGVAFVPEAWSQISHPSDATSPILDVAYPAIYFPNALSLAEAGKLSLTPGAVIIADFALHPVPSAHLFVRTPAAPSSAGPDDTQPADPVNINVARKIGEYVEDAAPVRREIAPGLTELSGIPPGEVTITSITQQDSGSTTFSQTLDLSGNRELDLTPRGGHSDVSGTVLLPTTPSPPATAPAGAQIVEDPRIQTSSDDPAEGEASISEGAGQVATRLQFRSAKTGESYAADVSVDGSFSLASASLPPGTYEVSFPDDFAHQVASMEATGAKVSGRTIDISGGEPVRLVVHVAEANCSVSGVVVKDGKPVAGAMLLLVPQDPTQDPATFHRDESDSDGTFMLGGVFPGRYTLLAIENGWDLEWASASVLFKYLPNGIPVDLRPGATPAFTVAAQ